MVQIEKDVKKLCDDFLSVKEVKNLQKSYKAVRDLITESLIEVSIILTDVRFLERDEEQIDTFLLLMNLESTLNIEFIKASRWAEVQGNKYLKASNLLSWNQSFKSRAFDNANTAECVEAVAFPVFKFFYTADRLIEVWKEATNPHREGV
ncbi:hypothetical protein [Brevibacillus invocatus]|uniref:hypothetical protein n=1 Tax=Brevibacillus invocatus TaxID=173959 RepID=UPI00203DD343|nr:hypothetical protein [Brevibacillus invocatus]MCM3079584.1 hypothetical protein [Brevibacillus invocatus]MCM3429782.1 hypothetical protein [Brevibacillus invocatus]